MVTSRTLKRKAVGRMATMFPAMLSDVSCIARARIPRPDVESPHTLVKPDMGLLMLDKLQFYGERQN